MYEAFFEKKFAALNDRYDEAFGMPLVNLKEWAPGANCGYHTRIGGKVHSTQETADYVELVYFLKKKDCYGRAERALRELISLQDADPASKTYGLWSYFAEEPLAQMLAPDYNKTDFLCRTFLYIMKEREECLSEEIKALLKLSMQRGAECSKRRNVSADYTNISVMSLNTIIGAAEICEDAELLEYGRCRLAKVLEFDAFSNSFSEYNSPCYTPLAMEEIARMRALFSDKACREMAEELDKIAWRMFAMHYHAATMQLAPPHIRAYSDLAKENVAMLVYLGTEGKYGKFSEKYVEMTRLPYRCPKELWHYFAPIADVPREVDETYYRKNSLRDPAEDTTIIRNVDSPDLRATSYLAKDYTLGSFRLCDTWVQRHNCMAIFGNSPDDLTVFRLRGMKADETQGAGYTYDTCMGFVTAHQKSNKILGQIGLTTDHGDFHYILDKSKDGVYTCDSLFFRFGFSEKTEGISAEKTEHGYRFAVQGHTLFVSVYQPVFAEEQVRLVWREDIKALDLVFFEGERRTLELHKIAASAATFTISVDEEMAPPVLRNEGNVRIAECEGLTVASAALPVSYDEAVAISAVSEGE